MSQAEVVQHVLHVLEAEGGKSIPATDLFEQLNKQRISSRQGRRALLELVDEHKVEITPDRQFRPVPVKVGQ